MEKCCANCVYRDKDVFGTYCTNKYSENACKTVENDECCYMWEEDDSYEQE